MTPASRVERASGSAAAASPVVPISDAETDESDDDDIPLARMKAIIEWEQKTFHNDWLKRA